jgi:hypothetical protein
MSKLRLLALALPILLLAAPASAASQRVVYSEISDKDSMVPANYPTPPKSEPRLDNSTSQPNLVSFGLGWSEGDEGASKGGLDARAEYRWGLSILSSLIHSTKGWDRYVQLHPMAGLESGSRLSLYAFGGVAADIMVFQNLILTPSLAVGYYGHGYGKNLGDAVEFRPQVELGYRFSNDVRTSVYYNYMSNWGMGDQNPGAEAIGIYLHVPTNVMFGR